MIERAAIDRPSGAALALAGQFGRCPSGRRSGGVRGQRRIVESKLRKPRRRGGGGGGSVACLLLRSFFRVLRRATASGRNQSIPSIDHCACWAIDRLGWPICWWSSVSKCSSVRICASICRSSFGTVRRGARGSIDLMTAGVNHPNSKQEGMTTFKSCGACWQQRRRDRSTWPCIRSIDRQHRASRVGATAQRTMVGYDHPPPCSQGT